MLSSKSIVKRPADLIAEIKKKMKKQRYMHMQHGLLHPCLLLQYVFHF